MSKELPNDAVIENAIIGAIITYPHKYNDIARYIVADGVWYDSRCKVLWKVITGMIRRKEHIDAMTITSSLDAGDYALGVDKVFVVDCTNNCGTESTIEVYAKKIYEKYLLRLVVESAKRLKARQWTTR